MSITTKITVFFLALVFVLTAGTGHARAQESSIDALLAQINALMQQVTTLQNQLAELRGEQQELREEVREVREELRSQLRIGSSGDEVTTLQEFLAEFEDLYPEGLITGYYGPLTESAVRRFQRKHGIDQVGEVGPKTRAKFNEMFKAKFMDKDNLPPGLAKKLDHYDDDEKKYKDTDKDEDEKEYKKEKKDYESKKDKKEKSYGKDKYEVCHKGKTLSLPAPALIAHLKHGDTLGECEDDDSDNDDDSDDDSDDDDSDDDSDDDTSTSTDETAPVISNSSVDYSTSTATFSWVTNEDATSKVVYALSTPVGDAAEQFTLHNGSLMMDHELEVDSLTPGTTYYYFLVSEDEAGNEAQSADGSFITDLLDETAPVISDVVGTSTSSTTATVTWTTDEDSTSKITFATSTPVGDASEQFMEDDVSLVTSHSLNLEGLTPGTTYYFFVTSVDEAGNESISSEGSFTTSS